MLQNILSSTEKINLFDRVRFSDRVLDNGEHKTIKRWGNAICYSRPSPHSRDLSIGVQCEDGAIYQISTTDIVDRLPAKQKVQPKFDLGHLVRVVGLNDLYSIQGIGLSFRGDRKNLKISYDLSANNRKNQILREQVKLAEPTNY